MPAPGMRRVGFRRLCRGVWRKRIDEASDLLCVCVCIYIYICIYICIYIYLLPWGCFPIFERKTLA